MNYPLIKLTLGVIATVGLYSVLWKENKFYRFWEHVFLGLAAGWSLVALWTESLKSTWWDKMVGVTAEGGGVDIPGFWPYALLLPVGLMGYFVFSRKHNWLSRIPIGIIIGLWSGQQVQVWWNRYGPQINGTLKPVIPNGGAMFVPDTSNMTPEAAAAVANNVYGSQALTNLIFIVTVLCVLSYFLFSFDFKNKFLKGMTLSGRWLLMVGFGAIFGSTVMMRFTLLIDRMYFVWIEWLRDTVLRAGG